MLNEIFVISGHHAAWLQGEPQTDRVKITDVRLEFLIAFQKKTSRLSISSALLSKKVSVSRGYEIKKCDLLSAYPKKYCAAGEEIVEVYQKQARASVWSLWLETLCSAY